jgi:hypothetical protein
MKRELGRIKSWLSARRLVLIPFFIIVLILAAGLSINEQRHYTLHKDSAVGAAIETSSLKSTVSKLNDSLSANKAPAEATSEYIDYMNAVNGSCSRINAYKTAVGGKDSALVSRMDQSVALCEDLSELASASGSVITAVRPLLQASTKPRRYQTLFPFGNITRRNHKKAVSNALTEVNKIDFKEIDYPFTAQSELKILQRAIDGSKGLDYLPALNKFQLQILGERQQFWAAYANIEALERSLTSQLDGYCQNLAPATSITECK